jgi:salicylate hydroxylase
MQNGKAPRIAIIGGGIGGLTLALALQRVGLQADVFEQAPQFTGIGAGVSLGPNAVRILQRLGLAEKLDAIQSLVTGFTFKRWQNGEIISDQHEALAYDYFGGLPVHRADILNILRTALPQSSLHTNKRCTSLTQSNEQISVSFADSSTFAADLLVGADGIHSVVRNTFHTDQPVFSNQIAYRGLLPMDRLSFLGEDRHKFCMWLGPERHFLIYPVSRGTLLNVVAFVPPEGDWRIESWGAQGDLNQLASEFSGWDPAVLHVIQAMDSTMRWALYDREPLDYWSVGRVTLLGDAAHAMLPHQGQGAGQSIEDAMILAHCLQESTGENISAWLKFYESLRKPRTTRVQETTRIAGKLYDLPDSETYRRGDNFSFSARSTWLWNYDSDQAFVEAKQTMPHP